MLTKQNKDDFFKVADSLKRFKRAEIKDQKERSLVESLYTDLLPEDQVFKMSLSDDTTFLIGRKGTGKSTIILRLESEYRKKKEYLPCYIDTKTVFESNRSDYQSFDYLNGKIPNEIIEQYLIERSFVQSILKSIVEELEVRASSWTSRLVSKLGLDKSKVVNAKIKELYNKIENNEHLKSIELPVINEYVSTISGVSEIENATKLNAGAKLGASNSISTTITAGISDSKKNKDIDSWEKRFSGALLKVFQIKSVMDEIKDILSIMGIKKIVIFLDDFSEVDEKTLKSFVDVVLTPMNNWGDEYVCFKVAAYPNRVYFGGIDKGKINIINLDFYNLYSNYDKNTMESLSLDFTKRLINTRIDYFSSVSTESFFDTRTTSLDEYFELIFQASMNVPRIMGYILFYCHQTHISLGKEINRAAIDSAAIKYYDSVIYSFFEVTSHSLISFDEKVSELQQKELLKLFIQKLKGIRKQIVIGELTGEVYQSDKNNPYTSHFQCSSNLEKFMNTLELNFFVTKYTEMSDRDGRKTSIYGLNYGLTLQENMRWGKPSGSKYRTYFISRPFDFNNIIEDFLRSSKQIKCCNPDCSKVYPYEQLQFLEFNKMKCNECQTEVLVNSISEHIEDELNKIERTKLLPTIELRILHQLHSLDKFVYAKDLAEELDLSSSLIAKRAKKLDEEKSLVNRNMNYTPYKYSISDKGREEYFN